jgi:hypothetical protein
LTPVAAQDLATSPPPHIIALDFSISLTSCVLSTDSNKPLPSPLEIPVAHCKVTPSPSEREIDLEVEKQYKCYPDVGGLTEAELKWLPSRDTT